MSWLLQNTLIGAALAAAVWIGCRLTKPRPALAHALWLCVLAKLVCPPIFDWAVPIEAPRALAAPVAVSAPPAGPPVRSRSTRAADARPAATGRVPAARDGRPRAAAMPPPAATPQSWTWQDVLLAAWLIGALLFALAMLFGIRRTHRLVSRGKAPSDWLAREVRALAGRLGVDAPEVRVVPRIPSAFVWSLGRPRLVWPEDHTWDAHGARTVIAHELAHLRRRDHWIARFEILAAICFWWQPLFWLARARMRLEAELACDAWAVWAVPSGRRAYAGALIDTLQRETRAVTALPALGARAGARRAFEARLLMILNADVPRRLSRWALVPIAGLCVTVLSGLSFAQERRGDRSQDPEKRIEERIRAIVREELAKELAELRGAREERTERRVEPREPRAPLGGGLDREALQGLRAQLRGALAEARREIRSDPDLKELGIADDLEKLLDGLLEGDDIDFGRLAGQLQGVLGKALRAKLDEGLAEARRELKAEGFDNVEFLDHIPGLLRGAIHGGADADRQADKFGRALMGFVGEALRKHLGEGLDEARRELKAEGFHNVEFLDHIPKLLESALDGRDSGEDGEAFGRALMSFVGEALKEHLGEARAELRREGFDADFLDDLPSLIEAAIEGRDFDSSKFEKSIRALVEQALEKEADRDAGRAPRRGRDR